MFSIVNHLQRVLRNQWKSKEELKRMQRKKLRSIINHAYKKSPFYHRIFKDAGLKPGDIKCKEDLKKVPIIHKKDIRENYKEVLARGYKKGDLIESRTSGSTGEVLKILMNKRTYLFYCALTYRNISSLGYLPWKKIAYIRYHPYEIGGILGKIAPLIYLPVSLDEKTQYNLLKRTDPDVVMGYPSNLLLISKILNDDIKIDFIRTEGELCTKEAMDYIERSFKTNVYDEYGSAEFANIAWQCKEKEKYHISIDNLVLEFLNENEEIDYGEKGKIIITSLENYAMPFIRYDIGDIGIPSDEKCNCGRNLPLMDLVEGREQEFFRGERGIISPRRIIPVLEMIDGIKAFRIIQDGKKIIIEEVIYPDYSKSAEMAIEKKFKLLFGDSFDIEFNYVEDIPKNKHGTVNPVVIKNKPKNL